MSEGQGFGSGSSRIKFLWIRIRFQRPDPIAKQECRKSFKSHLSEENLKIIIKDRQKIERQQFLMCLDPEPDPVLKNHGSGSRLS